MPNNYSPEWYAKHKEQQKACSKRYRERHKERIKAERAVYYQENKDKFRKASQRWRDNNREYYTERMRQYRRENPEIIKRITKGVRARNKARKIAFRSSHPELFHQSKLGHWIRNKPVLTPEQMAQRFAELRERQKKYYKKYLSNPENLERHRAKARECMRRKYRERKELNQT